MIYPHHMITSNQEQPGNFPQAEHIMLWLLLLPSLGNRGKMALIFITDLSEYPSSVLLEEKSSGYIQEKKGTPREAHYHKITDFIPKLQ